MRTLVIVLALAVTAPAIAHNNYFLPGDSYFASRVTKDMPLENLTLPFVRYERYAMKCGYLGYKNLELDLTPEQAKALGALIKRVFEAHADKAKKQTWGADKGKSTLPVLVYQRGLDLGKHRLWLRYNPNFDSIQTGEGKRHHATRSGPEDKALQAECRRGAKQVAGLELTGERPPLAGPGKRDGFMGIDAPISASGKGKIFVLPLTHDLYGLAARKDGLRFYVLDGAKATLYEYKGGKAVELDGVK